MGQVRALATRVHAKLGGKFLHSRKWLYHRLRVPGRGAETRRVVFVAGVQRSGTNMIMDMLERSYRTEVFHERDPRAFERYQLRDTAVLKPLVAHSHAPTVVFKAISESQWLARLLHEFAPAQGLWIYRHYEPVVRSHVRKWRGMLHTVRMLATDADATDGWRGQGMSAQTRAFVTDCYHESINNESACALFWYFRNILFFEQGLDRAGHVRLVSYEDMVAAREPSARALFDFLDLPFRPAVCDIVSPSAAAPAPRHDRLAIDAPIRAACDRLLARLEQTVKAQQHDKPCSP